MVNFDLNSEEGRRITHSFYQTHHREASAADIRRDMGDARVGSSAGSGSNIVGNGLYRETTDNRGIVSGVATDILSVDRIEWIQGGIA